MKEACILAAALLACVPFVSVALAEAELKDGVSGFYGDDGTYYLIGVVKNNNDYDAIATATVMVEYGGSAVEVSAATHSMAPGGEMPFKIPLDATDGEIPKILGARASHIRGLQQSVSIEVIYDETLVVHPDGHVTGRIVNTGNETAKHVELFAVAHGRDHGRLDVASNALPLAYVMPGEIREFSMYPDPAIAGGVWYYSCFGLGDLSVIPLNVRHADGILPMRYDSGLLLAYPEFNGANTELNITIVGGWPLHDSINIEFPRIDDAEKFDLSIDGEPIEFIQSLDEFDNWHVAFNVEPQTSGILTIAGFDPDAIYDRIPPHVREQAGLWAAERIGTGEFAESASYLVGRPGAVSHVPDWVRSSAGWWSAGLVTDKEFSDSLKYLESAGVLSLDAPGSP